MRPAVAGGWRTVVAQGAGRRTSPTACTRTRTAASPAARCRSAGTSQRRSTAPSRCPSGSWSHVAATYDGAAAAPLRQRRRRSAQLAVAGSIATLDRPLQHRRQRRLGRVVQRHDRRGSRLQPRAQRRARSRTTWSAASRRTRSRRRSPRGRRRPAPRASTPAPRPTVTFNELMDAGIDHRLELPAEGRGQRRRPGDRRRTTPRRSTATLTPQNALTYGATYTVTVKGGAGGVTRPRRQPARGRLDAGRSRSRRRRRRSSSSARPANAFGVVPRRDPAQRGPERVHDDRRRVRLARTARAVRRRRPRRHAAERRPR